MFDLTQGAFAEIRLKQSVRATFYTAHSVPVDISFSSRGDTIIHNLIASISSSVVFSFNHRGISYKGASCFPPVFVPSQKTTGLFSIWCGKAKKEGLRAAGALTGCSINQRRVVCIEDEFTMNNMCIHSFVEQSIEKRARQLPGRLSSFPFTE